MTNWLTHWLLLFCQVWSDWLTHDSLIDSLVVIVLSGMVWLADSWLIDWLCCCSVRYGLIGWLMTDWLTLLLFCQVWPDWLTHDWLIDFVVVLSGMAWKTQRACPQRNWKRFLLLTLSEWRFCFLWLLYLYFVIFKLYKTAMNSNCFLSWLHYAGVWKQTSLLQQSNHVFTDIDQAVHCAEWQHSFLELVETVAFGANHSRKLVVCWNKLSKNSLLSSGAISKHFQVGCTILQPHQAFLGWKQSLMAQI